ncbi:hypothetical protein [Shimia abyssi]|uniref:Uncharacterized protein n=1 Tax=Shimia abyssi TaxID=1662395 RepID=A0A2P8F7Q0_9RHOB|nr:hypothetical protein [Shimia abyssi]PSL17739.1 hypothetical protein CLV88_11586 [Shimia abyssi]
MSTLLKTVEAFPRGRSSQELYALIDTDFTATRREEILTELLSLQKRGLVLLGHDNKWRTATRVIAKSSGPEAGTPARACTNQVEAMVASPARFGTEQDAFVFASEELEVDGAINANALLRYYRAALQSDPRGALTQANDRHGTAF